MTKERKFQIEQLLQVPQALLHKEQISEQVSGKIILVTGAAGSIGSEIVKQLLLYVPKTLLLVDVAEMPLNKLCLKLEGIQKTTQLIPYLGDIKDEKLMQQLFATHQPDIVYHTAANKHVPLLEGFPYQAIQNNVLGTKIIADLAVAFHVKTFVFISTDKAVNPSSIMGASKRIAEQYILSENEMSEKTNFIITRFGNVFGSSGSVGPIFSRQIKAGGPVTITHPEMERYFMTLTQACELVLEAGAMGKGGEIFMFDMGAPIRIVDLAHQMIVSAGLLPEIDIKIEWIGLRPGEKLQEDLTTINDVLVETNHPQIKLVQPVNNSQKEQKAKEISAFLLHLTTLQEVDIVKEMKKIVPEFKSKHSVYTDLD
ncbi:polysaccharide biosynthesis protein [Flavobacterium sp.]|uniref:polysaccharide biosynthesis protein n=1 Tax=Flavobacterium sp. TaxID=239 RepID=UPI002FDDC70B